MNSHLHSKSKNNQIGCYVYQSILINNMELTFHLHLFLKPSQAEVQPSIVFFLYDQISFTHTALFLCFVLVISSDSLLLPSNFRGVLNPDSLCLR